MKPRFTNQKSSALTLIEVLLVILILAVLVAMFLPVYSASHRRAYRVECVSNLRQISMAYQFWERDHSIADLLEMFQRSGLMTNWLVIS